MKRKIIASLLAVMVIAGLVLVGCAKPAPTPTPSAPIELKMSHFMSVKHVQHAQVMAPFAEEVEKATDGRVKITIYPGGALGKPPEQYQAAVSGITDIAFGLQCYTPGKFPLTSVLELPCMVTSAEAGSHVLWDLYQEFPEIQAEYPAVKILWLWTHDTGQLITNKPIRKLDDLKGMKLRCPGAYQTKMIESWGATPVMMPISELYDSIQKGVADGTVAPLSVIYDFNLYDVSKYVTIGNFYVCTFFMVMNPDSWDRISAQDQKIIEGLIGKRMSDEAGAAYDAGAKLGLETCEEAGIEIYTLPPDELAKWKTVMMPLDKQWVADIEAKGLPGEKVYNEAVKLAEKYNK